MISLSIKDEASPGRVRPGRRRHVIRGQSGLYPVLQSQEQSPRVNWHETFADAIPISRAQAPHPNTIRRQFNELAETWRRQKGGISSISKKVSLPAYLRIIRLGSPVIPLLLEELQRRPDHWFVALEVLANENPVRESERADFNQTVAAWLRWGRERGYI